MKYVPLGVLADANAYIMIIVGALVMFVAIFGMIGAWKSIRGCLWAVSIHISIRPCLLTKVSFIEIKMSLWCGI